MFTSRLVCLLLVIASALLPGAGLVSAAADDEEVVVAEALSGSVIVVQDRLGGLSPVHYVGVEAPSRDQPYHEEARQANGAHVVGKPALLRRVGQDRLPDGARLRHVFLLENGATREDPGQPIATTLLADGQVWRVADAANDLDRWYRELEAEPRVTRTGVWEAYRWTPAPQYLGSLPPRDGGELARPAPLPASVSALVPAPAGMAWAGVHADTRMYPSLSAVEELGDGWSWVFPTLRDNEVRVLFETVPAYVGGFFAPNPNVVVINSRFSRSDPKAIASAIVHESSHVRDYYAGELMRTLEGCYETEIRAYKNEAQAWLHFYGPTGKQPAADELEQGLNDLVILFHKDPDQIDRFVRRAYLNQCTRISAS